MKIIALGKALKKTRVDRETKVEKTLLSWEGTLNKMRVYISFSADSDVIMTQCPEGQHTRLDIDVRGTNMPGEEPAIPAPAAGDGAAVAAATNELVLDFTHVQDEIPPEEQAAHARELMDQRNERRRNARANLRAAIKQPAQKPAPQKPAPVPPAGGDRVIDAGALQPPAGNGTAEEEEA